MRTASGSAAPDTFDVARVRGLYQSVGSGTASLDGPLGTLQPESVTRAIVATLRAAPTQPGSTSFRSQRSASSVAQTRRAFADLVGGTPDSVVLGSAATTLHMQFAELLQRDWKLGDQLVLSRLDSDAVVTPWLRAARAAGASVRWAEVDLETGELPAWQYEHLITPHTRLVSIPIGNPATGTLPDVAAIAELAHQVGALVVVDVGGAAPHVLLDIAGLGADLMSVSAITFGGPTLAAMIARPGLLIELDDGSHPSAPQRYEFRPLPVELLDGATASVDHLAGLDEQATGGRRERLAGSIPSAGAHTAGLWDYFHARVAELAHVTVLGGSGRRLPMFAFTVARRRPAQVGAFLADRGVSVWTGPSGMTQLMTTFGADEFGGAVFAGFMPYTTPAEVDRLLDGLSALD
jgi:cysteine desulfurase family protein (TIGR01976 family)